MELNWSTFILEIINFLILIWILKHFLYKPVLDVIARRRAAIEKTLDDAKLHHEEADKLQQQYAGRLTEWEQERQQARNKLADDIEAERAEKLSALQTELEQQREKALVAEAHRQADILRKMEATALQQGAQFVTRLLQQAAGPDTEARLIDLVLTDLKQLSDEHIAELHKSFEKMPETIFISSAYPVSDQQRHALEEVLHKITKTEIPLQFEQNKDLLAGVRITIGAWVLGANLLDELQGFRELSHEQ